MSNQSRLRIQWLIKLIFILFCTLLFSLQTNMIYAFDTKPHVPIDTVDLTNWMDQILDDKQPISVLSIPGTHDSAAYNGTNWLGIVQAQTKDITHQLLQGIRFLDLRVAQDGSMHHGSVWVGGWGGITEHFHEIKSFLDVHPNEFIIARIKNENFSYKTYDDWIKYQTMLKKALDESGLNNYIYHDRSKAPIVEDVRGKFVIIDDTQGALHDMAQYNWYEPSIQDTYKDVNDSTKLELIKQQSVTANYNLNDLTINFLSYTAGIANIQRLAKDMNSKYNAWLTQVSHQYDTLGILPMDVSDENIIRNIIDINQHARNLFELQKEYEKCLKSPQDLLFTDINQDGIIDENEKDELDRCIENANEIKQQLEQELQDHTYSVGETAAVLRIKAYLQEHPIPDTSNIQAFDLQPYLESIEKAEQTNQKLSAIKEKAFENGLLPTKEKELMDTIIQEVQKLKNDALKALQESFPEGTKRDSLIQRINQIIPVEISSQKIMNVSLQSEQKIYDGQPASYLKSPVILKYVDHNQNTIEEAFSDFGINDISFFKDSHKEIETPVNRNSYSIKLSETGYKKIADYAKSKGLILLEDAAIQASYTINPRSITITANDQVLTKKDIKNIPVSFSTDDISKVLEQDINIGKVKLSESLSSHLNPEHLQIGKSYDSALILNISGSGIDNYNITFVAGQLTVKKDEQIVTVPNTGLTFNCIVGICFIGFGLMLLIFLKYQKKR